ncbi:MAG: transcriptional regulator [Planctomycetota bacterium]|nr:MAG: transcriptional regulator [Planctomycetota bacterium]
MLNGFVDGVMGTLPRAAVCVWLCLYRDTKAGGLARTGVADLAKRARCDRSTVIRALRLLVEGGNLEVVRRGGIGRGPSTYRVK